jgi:hypothetical protein
MRLVLRLATGHRGMLRRQNAQTRLLSYANAITLVIGRFSAKSPPPLGSDAVVLRDDDISAGMTIFNTRPAFHGIVQMKHLSHRTPDSR